LETLARLDALRLHLARAGMLSEQLALERALAAVQALDTIGLPAARCSVKISASWWLTLALKP
jgi:hypothetical protein